eukprot:13511356-Alexandrium_andersonii.AAC.1
MEHFSLLRGSSAASHFSLTAFQTLPRIMGIKDQCNIIQVGSKNIWGSPGPELSNNLFHERPGGKGVGQGSQGAPLIEARGG